jgi:hypothetical protein
MTEHHQFPDGRQLVMLSDRSAELRSLGGAHVCYLRAEAVTIYPTIAEQRLHMQHVALPGVVEFINRYGHAKHRALYSRFMS